MVDLGAHLSPHFTVGELCRTAHAGIDNTPNQDAVYHLTSLCQLVLEPLRAKFGPLWVSSGYRCPALNKAIGGVHDSAHVFGFAADVVPASPDITIASMVRWLRESPIEFDQAIDESTGPGSAWCHVGLLRPGFEPKPRRECLVFRGGIYTPFAA